MGIILTDMGFLLFVFVIFGIGAAAAVVDFILDHLIIIGLFFAAKSLLLFGKTVFQKDQSLGDKASSTTLIVLDVVRGIGTMICTALLLDYVFFTGFIELVLGILLTLPIMGLVLLAASEGAMALVYFYLGETERVLDRRMKRNSIICEIISIALVIGYYFMWQAMNS